MNKNVVICSLGRCGSTHLYRSVLKTGHYKKRLIRKGKRKGFIRNINDLNSIDVDECCFKSHDFAPEYLPEGTKVVFLFGNPRHIIVSIKNNENRLGRNTWIKRHFLNLNSDFSKYPQMLEKDVLNLEKNFDSYNSTHNYDILSVRYETMWNYQDEIGEFVGVDNLDLGKLKERDSVSALNDMSEEDVKMINKTYSSLISKIEQAPDINLLKGN